MAAIEVAVTNAAAQRSRRRGRAFRLMRACMSCSGRSESVIFNRRYSRSRKRTSVSRR